MECICDNDLYWKTKKQETLNILAYSDIFDYPLTLDELYERGKIELNELKVFLEELIQEDRIFLIKNFYSLHNDKKIVEKRESRNVLAKKFIPKAKLMAKIISHFPFIRSICLSGSISKNCMDKDSDIDFFIITEPKRVWIVRLICFIVIKTILLNKSKYLCPNFIIDSEHLTINNKSIYTAIEIKTLIPLYGYNYYEKLLKKNEWVGDFFPNYPMAPNIDLLKEESYIQKILEAVFNNHFGDWLDKWFFNWSVQNRMKRFAPKFFQNSGFYIDFQRHIAKEHYANYHPNTIKEYNHRVEQQA